MKNAWKRIGPESVMSASLFYLRNNFDIALSGTYSRLVLIRDGRMNAGRDKRSGCFNLKLPEAAICQSQKILKKTIRRNPRKRPKRKNRPSGKKRINNLTVTLHQPAHGKAAGNIRPDVDRAGRPSESSCQAGLKPADQFVFMNIGDTEPVARPRDGHIG